MRTDLSESCPILTRPRSIEGCRRGTARLRRSFLLLIFLLSSVHLCSAQNLSWELPGASSLDSAAARALSSVSDTDSAIRILLTLYTAAGYFDVTVRPVGERRLLVEEGVRYRLDSIEIDQTGPEPAEPGTSRDFFSQGLIDSILRRLMHVYESRGYLLASVTIDQVLPDSTDHTVTLRLRVESGPRMRIGRIGFTGSEGTSEAYLRRLSGLTVGEPYDPDRVARAQGRLYRSGLFAPVPPPEIRLLEGSEVELLFLLDTRQVNSFDGAVGYQPALDRGSDGFFTGSVDIGLRNIFGSGERIAGSWSKLDDVSSDLSLVLALPYLFSLPVGLDLSFSQIVEEERAAFTSWIERDLQGLVTLELGGEWRIEGGGAISSILPAPDTSGDPCSDRVLPASRLLSLIIGLRYDSRDLPMNPRRGTLYRSRFGVGTRSVDRPGGGCPDRQEAAVEQARQNAAVELAHALGLGGPLVLVGRIDGTILVGEGIDESELYRIGGFNSVRGYRSGSFRGSRSVVGSIEGRVLLSEFSHTGLFLDAGYVYRPERSSEGATESRLLGYGALFQVDTPAGIARFSVGLAEGAAVEDATISVGLVGSF